MGIISYWLPGTYFVIGLWCYYCTKPYSLVGAAFCIWYNMYCIDVRFQVYIRSGYKAALKQEWNVTVVIPLRDADFF